MNTHICTALTRILAADVVVLADELVLIQDVQLLPGGELFPAHHAREAFQMEHLVPRAPYQVVRRDSLRTAATFRTEPPGMNTVYLYRETMEENCKKNAIKHSQFYHCVPVIITIHPIKTLGLWT